MESRYYSKKLNIIVVSGDRKLLIVDTKNGEISNYDQELSGCNPVITSDMKIIKGTGEHDISFFSLKGELIDFIPGRYITAEAICYIGNNKIALGSGDKKVHSLDLLSGKEQTLALQNETVSSKAFSSLPAKKYSLPLSFHSSLSLFFLPFLTGLLLILVLISLLVFFINFFGFILYNSPF